MLLSVLKMRAELNIALFLSYPMTALQAGLRHSMFPTTQSKLKGISLICSPRTEN